jgi:solute carrier family 25 oxoglutarate transporter 11
MMPDEHGKLPYKGFGDCFMKTASREGVAGLWVGFNTFFARVAPHAIISLVLIDVFKSLFE